MIKLNLIKDGLAIFNKIFWKCTCVCALLANWNCKLKRLMSGW